ncbi:class I SAM-dependent methyltransferase [Streptomyces lonegramiae]|uniref:Class I SAM-dependent methyltransferase n=1 Tax=Streptomyces lonegramiae TaxID=3075524 RepID=A0ABU2XP26_9ACTN|nr:class I SAM-dependent methyltransferase [Streptomyces sp. DSM 41529]MDT0547688.1 class I SAM-dependent methyltransferase [Streptomyces sp. DSM 41529]
MTTSPFLGPDAIEALYGRADRLATRTSALHRAKVAGRPVAEVIASLASAYGQRRGPQVVADIGCGRGSSTRVLATRLRPAGLIGIDASAALLADARRRNDFPVSWAQADFHRLPLPSASCTVVVAAFCLYHSPRPETVVSEIARCLAPGGIAVLVTKSADSYQELDDVVADADLDKDAHNRPSLYASAHSGNLAALASAALGIVHIEHEEHRFLFHVRQHLAEYLATTPKYRLPPEPVIRASLPNRPTPASSVVTYVVAARYGLIS